MRLKKIVDGKQQQQKQREKKNTKCYVSCIYPSPFLININFYVIY